MTTTPNWDHADLAAQADRRDVGLLEALQARDAEGLALGIKLPDAAKLLGVSQRHLYNQVNARMVPCFWIGKALRFSPAALSEWVARQSANSVAWQTADPGKRVPQSDADPDRESPAPKTTHAHRAGEWVTIATGE